MKDASQRHQHWDTVIPNNSKYFSVLFFSRPRSEGWPHHWHTFSIYLCPLSFWSTLPRGVLTKSWCCPSSPCVVFLACVHLALFLALSLSPGNSLVSSWCDFLQGLQLWGILQWSRSSAVPTAARHSLRAIF